ncbi:DUF3349 domain-containing protein [Microbacterium dextranolyticum]|uniref:DUF3349 domain-containing protein n=1 Tax=Microbacterium dextranolyticum TaxID=36806 RepID=A0A9W6HKM2_9MICO|nr:DUF3349 domain-containing protein [Microbacterium dextranolyticum]MBM7462322.1 hypothetical protein [Microbacterium dextranolyticum]GLJ94572.1 hypothetical protein GCM10017591_06330 [Microbacterium dextranolyticum]
MAEGIGAAILRWLRAGYPEGVPPTDYYPLLALLRRTLSSAEFEAVVEALETRDDAVVRVSDIRAAIEHVTSEPPEEADIRLVASRLAAAGWPLSGSARQWAEPEAPVPPAGPGLIERVLAWLRRGYPEGIPASDYVPILAVLRRRLSDDEVTRIADALVAIGAERGEVSVVDARVLMSKVLDDLPSDEDLARVEERLTASGLVLDRPGGA